MASGSVNLGGKVINQAGSPKVSLTVELYQAATWEAAGAATATTTTDSDGLWAFATQDISQTWITVVLDGDKKYLIDARNKMQFTELDLITSLNADTIYEHTAASGVTIDGMLIKDGVILATAVPSLAASKITAGTFAAGTFSFLGSTLTTLGTVSAGALAGLTGLGIRSTGAAYDLTLAVAEVLTGAKTLTFQVGDTSRTLILGASPSLSGTNTGDNAANSSSTYIGTTAVALNRASAALTLAGITLTTPDIGTPSAGVGTNLTGIPAAAILAGSFGAGAFVVSTSLQAATIELGAATDTTLARSAAGAITVEGVQVILSGAALGTPASGTLTNCTIPGTAISGTTLAATVVTSSLTSVGTLASPVLTTPDINGGTADALTSLGVRSTGTGAFDLKIANAENLTVGAKTLTLQLGDADRTLILGASPSLSGTNTGDNSANSSSTYIGTTAVALNRASAALTLAGITLTTPDIGTPSAGVGTNLTGIPAAAILQGTMASGMVLVAPALGTPASGTMTNVTGIPAAAILAGSFGAGAFVVSTSLQAATIELSHATENTLSASGGVLSIEAVAIPTISSTSTLTNKRITPRVVTTADDATAIIDVDITDQYQLTAMANNTTISTTGTPVAGQKLVIRLKDDATARTLTWDAVFRAVGVTLPTTTVISKTHYIGCIYNATDTKWDAVAVVAQA